MQELRKRTAGNKELTERGQWSKKTEFLLAMAGNIVGLGNVWRFPYLCFKNGGGAFLIPYILFTVTCGVPLFVLEVSVGQYTKQSPAIFWGRLCPLAEGFGHGSYVIVLYSCLAYNMLLAWGLFYLISSMSSPLPWTTCGNHWNTGLTLSTICSLQIIQNNPPCWILVAACVRFRIVTIAYKAKNAPAPFYRKAAIAHRTAPHFLRSLSTVRFVSLSLKELVNCIEHTSNQTFMIPNGTHGNFSISSATEFWERRVLNISQGIDTLGNLNWEIFLCLLASWVACYFCIWKGVKSTGKAVYFTATFPYVMLLLLLIRGLTLPGALTGIKYYLYPKLSSLADSQVWIDAATQIFFSYSLATGSVAVLGSYNTYKTNSYRYSIWLCVLNNCTSFLAGFVVFSVLGFMAERLGADIEDIARPGPGLAFIIYPQAVAMMPLPQLWAVCFFFMLLLLGLDTQFVGLELITSTAIDMFPNVLRRPYRRELFLLFFCTACFCFQILMTTQGGIYIFQLIDYYGSSGASLLFMCLLESIIIGWIFGADRLFDVIQDMCNQRPCAFFKYCWRYFTPLMCLGAFVFYLAKYEALMYNNVYVYPNWAYGLGWVMVILSPVLVIAWGLVKLYTSTGSLKQRFKRLCMPDETLPITEMQRTQLQISETAMSRI